MSDHHLDENGFVVLDSEQTEPHRSATAIEDCSLCDAEGTRNGFPCDHIDHAASTEHGRALVRAELDKIRQRKGGDQ